MMSRHRSHARGLRLARAVGACAAAGAYWLLAGAEARAQTSATPGQGVTPPLPPPPPGAPPPPLTLAPLPPLALDNPRNADLALAQATPLTLDELVASVERNFPLIEAAQRDVVAAEAEVLAAEGAFDPAVRVRGAATAFGYYQYGRLEAGVEVPTQLWGTTLFAGWRIGRGFTVPSAASPEYVGFPEYYGYMATNPGGELRAGVSVPLWRNGPIDRRRATIRRAELGRPVAELGVLAQRLESVRLGSQRYWDWVAAGERYAIARALLELAFTRDAALAARVQRGDIAAIEQTENNRAVVQRQGFVVSAERGLQQAALELSVYLRDGRGAAVLPDAARLPRGFPEPVAFDAVSVRDQVTRAVRRRPEVQRFRLLQEQLRIERDWARNQLAPAIDVTIAGVQPLPPFEVSSRPLRPALDVGLSVEIPILTRVATGRIRAAEAGVARAEAQADLARDRISVEVRDALSAIEAARQRVLLARREVDVARQLETAERARFDAGDSTLLFVNLREQAAAEARLREVDALADYHKAVAAYRAATGAGARAAR